MMWADILTELGRFFYLVFFSPILGHNVKLRLLYHILVDTWLGVWFQHAFIILTWSVGDTYHPLSLHFPLDRLDLMKRWDSPGPHGVICICPDEEVPWKYIHFLLPHGDHWVSCLEYFQLYSQNNGICYTSNLIRFLSAWHLITWKARLVVWENVQWVEG